MTFLEQKLLDLFRACSDEQKFKILELADIIHKYPDPDPYLPIRPQLLILIRRLSALVRGCCRPRKRLKFRNCTRWFSVSCVISMI